LEQGKKRWIKDEYTFNTLGYQWHNIQKIEASETYEDGETIVITSSPQSSPLKGEGGFTLNLKPGQTHEQVKLLQQYLNTHGYQLTLSGPGSPNNETSYFGPPTKQALLRFQKANGLKESGVVDEGVREVLNQ